MKSGLKTRFLATPSVIGLELTYLTESSGKWLVVVKKSQKYQTQREIDSLINATIFPESQTEKPSRSNRHIISISLVTYVATLQKEFTPSTIQFHNQTQNTYTRQIRASYGIENEDLFPIIRQQKEKKTTPKHNISNSNTTLTTAFVTTDDSAIVLSFFMIMFKDVLKKKYYIQRGYRDLLQESGHKTTKIKQQCND